MKTHIACLVLLSVVALSVPALADPKGNVVTTKVVDIIGQRRVPIASIDVSRVAPTVKLSELRSPFTDRVDQAVHAGPF